MPGVGQHVQRPEVAVANGKTGRAVAQHLHAAGVLEHPLGTHHVVAEVGLVKVAHALVAVAVAGEFVALLHDAAHHGRVALSHPTQGEERGLGAFLGQDGQDAVHVAFDAALAAVPVAAADVGRHRGDLEVVFHVDGEGVLSIVLHQHEGAP